jgi:hypothetical protein
MARDSKAVFFCALMGVWGVFTGLAVFLHVRNELDRGIVVLIFGLLIAAVMAYIVDTIREKIHHGTYGAAQPFSATRVLGTMVLLATLELVISASGDVADLVVNTQRTADETAGFLGGLMGSAVGSKATVLTQLVAFGMLWAVVAASIAFIIASRSLRVDSSTEKSTTGSRILWSIGLATVAATAATVAYLFVTRLILTVYTIIVDPAGYSPYFGAGADWAGTSSSVRNDIRSPFFMASAIVALAHWTPFGPYLALGGLVLLVIVGFGAKTGWIRFWCLCAFVLCVGGTWFTDEGQLERLVASILGTILVWLVPIAFLSAAAPFLQPLSDKPRLWGFASFVAAGLLILATALRLFHGELGTQESIFIVLTGVVLVGGGILFLLGASAREFWPFAALAVATGVTCVTMLLHRINTLDSFRSSVLVTMGSMSRQVTPWDHDSMDRLSDELLTKAAPFNSPGWFNGGSMTSEIHALLPEFDKQLLLEQASIPVSLCGPVGYGPADSWARDLYETPGDDAPRSSKTMCASLREIFAQPVECDQTSKEARSAARQDNRQCRSRQLVALAADAEARTQTRGPIDTRRADRIADAEGTLTHANAGFRLKDRLISLLADFDPFTRVVPSTAPRPSSLAEEIQQRLSPRWRGLGTEQARLLVLNPPGELNDTDWTLLLIAWVTDIGRPSPIIVRKIVHCSLKSSWGKLAALAADTPRCDSAPLGIRDFDLFRSRLILRFAAVVDSIARADSGGQNPDDSAADGGRYCRPLAEPLAYAGISADPTEPDEIRLNNEIRNLDKPIRSYICLRRERDRLDDLIRQIAAIDASEPVARGLELCLVGCVAFWVVAGLLAGWSETALEGGPAHANDREIAGNRSKGDRS